MTYSVEKFSTVKAAKIIFDEAKDWPKKGSQEYDVLRACDILFRYVRLKYRVNIYAIRDGKGKLVAIMPIRPRGVDTVEIAGSYELMDFADFIYNPKAKKQEVCDFFYNYLHEKEGVKHFVTRFVEPTSPTFKAAKKFKGFKDTRTRKNVNVNIAYDTYEEYFSTLSKHAKQNLRTAYNRAERDGKKIELVWYSGDVNTLKKNPEARRDIKECMNLYIDRQLNTYVKERASTYAFRIRMFHYLSVSAKTNKRGFFAILKIDGKIGAFMQGFYDPFDKEYEAPRLAFNEEFKFYSPGMILVAEAIKKCIGDKDVTHLNLLRGDEQYKFAMGGEEYLTKEYRIDF